MQDDGEEVDEEIREIMESHDLDSESAARVPDIRDNYGVDEDTAIELDDLGLD